VPDSTAMRRVIALAALAAVLVVATGCGSRKASPGLSTVDLAPTVELDLHGCPKIPSTSTTVSCSAALEVTRVGDPLGAPVRSVPTGAVMLIKNASSQDRRVTGSIQDDQVFDTGAMHPRDTTTIRLDTSGRVTITESTGGDHTTLVVALPPVTKR
jgi:hypothetical protein